MSFLSCVSSTCFDFFARCISNCSPKFCTGCKDCCINKCATTDQLLDWGSHLGGPEKSPELFSFKPLAEIVRNQIGNSMLSVAASRGDKHARAKLNYIEAQNANNIKARDEADRKMRDNFRAYEARRIEENNQRIEARKRAEQTRLEEQEAERRMLEANPELAFQKKMHDEKMAELRKQTELLEQTKQAAWDAERAARDAEHAANMAALS
jgi:hypothetical protein